MALKVKIQNMHFRRPSSFPVSINHFMLRNLHPCMPVIKFNLAKKEFIEGTSTMKQNLRKAAGRKLCSKGGTIGGNMKSVWEIPENNAIKTKQVCLMSLFQQSMLCKEGLLLWCSDEQSSWKGFKVNIGKYKRHFKKAC